MPPPGAIGEPLYDANGELDCMGDVAEQPTNEAPSKDAPTIPAATSNLTRSCDSLMTRSPLFSQVLLGSRRLRAIEESTTRSRCRYGRKFEIGFVGDGERGGRNSTNSPNRVKTGFLPGKLATQPCDASDRKAEFQARTDRSLALLRGRCRRQPVVFGDANGRHV